LGLSEGFLRKARKRGSDFLGHLKYPPHVKRVKVAPDDIETFQDFLNDQIPIQSGRNFRRQPFSTSHLYKLYSEGHPDDLTEATFRKLLKKENVHHDDKPDFCGYCNGDYKDKRKGSGKNLEDHIRAKNAQMGYYKLMKAGLKTDNSYILIVQDFTQLNYDTKDIQDLVICVYYHDPDHESKIGLDKYHHIGAFPNTMSFVRTVWDKFIAHAIESYHPEEVLIFSDGCGRHFKISENMEMWRSFAINFNIKFNYYFFASNHGHSVCDAVAANSKRAIKLYKQEHKTVITEVETIDEIINIESNSVSMLITNLSDANIDEFEAMTGITKCHVFEFHHDGSLHAYQDAYSFETFVEY